MSGDHPHILTSRDQLRELVGEPSERVAKKTINHIDEICANFIAASPYVIVATKGKDGLLDLSPKGDPAGFVEVLDSHTLAIPDRLGNSRFDSYENLFIDSTVSLIFLIPGHNDTLRVAGEGKISRDPDLLARYPVNGKEPLFVLLVNVKEAFFHCGKSIVRSGLWRSESWRAAAGVPSLAEAMVAHGKLSLPIVEMQEIIDRDRDTRLY